MTILEAIRKRHSVRKYTNKTIPKELVEQLEKEISEINKKEDLSICLFINEKKAFGSFLHHFGRFSKVANFLALVTKDPSEETKLAYYGEHLVLRLQSLGLNSCWVGATYNKKAVSRITASKGNIICVISFGYGISDGKLRKSKTMEEVANISASSPEWFIKGIEAALLAPTALNKQNFKFIQNGDKVSIISNGGAYSKIDLGIVKYHFEIGAGINNFKWLD